MTKTETADLAATMAQIQRVAEAGADIVRCRGAARAGRRGAQDDRARVADPDHRRHPLQPHAGAEGARRGRALRAAEPGQHRRPRQGRARSWRSAKELGTPLRIGVNSGSLPKHLHALERENSVEALVTAAVEFVELMERLEFDELQGLDQVDERAEHDRRRTACCRERIPYPLHLGITEAGTKWSGSLKSAVGLGTLLADGIGDTIRISLSTFHAEEEVKVAWEILKALQLRERGPVLIACPTCGRLQFDMDTVVADIEKRLEAYEEPIEVAVLGCAVNGIGEASHADFGITGAKNEGLIFSRGRALRKVPTGAARRHALRGDRQVRRLGREADRRRRSARRPRARRGCRRSRTRTRAR